MQRKNLFLSLVTLAIMVVGLIACQPEKTTPPGELASSQVPSSGGSPTEAPPQNTIILTETAPDPIQSSWEASPHGHTYVLDELGMNATCARCHAPLNFIPSMTDMPESCATCKFEIDPPPPTIAEANWKNIPCSVCHRTKRGEVDPKYAWLSIPPIDEYEDVATTTELCLKCHSQEIDLAGHPTPDLAIDLAGHPTPDLAKAHTGYTCTQCHDAHSTIPSCASGSCHAD